jgi:hypothetical protein
VRVLAAARLHLGELIEARVERSEGEYVAMLQAAGDVGVDRGDVLGDEFVDQCELRLEVRRVGEAIDPLAFSEHGGRAAPEVEEGPGEGVTELALEAQHGSRRAAIGVDVGDLGGESSKLGLVAAVARLAERDPGGGLLGLQRLEETLRSEKTPEEVAMQSVEIGRRARRAKSVEKFLDVPLLAGVERVIDESASSRRSRRSGPLLIPARSQTAGSPRVHQDDVEDGALGASGRLARHHTGTKGDQRIGVRGELAEDLRPLGVG